MKEFANIDFRTVSKLTRKLWNPTDGTVYVLEMQGNPEQEELVFESIYNPYWNNPTTWEVVLETDIALDEVDRLINYADQGWYNAGVHSHCSFMLVLRNRLTVETEAIEMYVNAVNNIGGDIKVVDYYPVKH